VKLPRNIQQQARSAYRRFKVDPEHPGLQFKWLNQALRLWFVRISDNYRPVGVRNGDEIVWFVIGTHAEYDRLLATL
jgi:hypothetical protein